MAVIYMVHPTHGAKVAISEDEANYDETYGWMRYDPDEPAFEEEEEAEAVNALAPQPSGRRRATQEG
jgi:hypothetical protein